MNLIDKNKIDFCTIETDDFSGNQIIEVVFKEDIEGLPTAKAIPTEELEKAIEIIENMATCFGTYIDKADALEILDKILESEGK